MKLADNFSDLRTFMAVPVSYASLSELFMETKNKSIVDTVPKQKKEHCRYSSKTKNKRLDLFCLKYLSQLIYFTRNIGPSGLTLLEKSPEGPIFLVK
jgi:hypothetical protein